MLTALNLRVNLTSILAGTVAQYLLKSTSPPPSQKQNRSDSISSRKATRDRVYLVKGFRSESNTNMNLKISDHVTQMSSLHKQKRTFLPR